MLNYIFLAGVVAFVAVQSVSQKTYGRKAPNGSLSFLSGSSFVAMLVFVLTSGGKLAFTAQTLPYSVGFAVSYSLCYFGLLTALRIGPLSLTSLVRACSLIIPTLYGLVVLKEPGSLTLYLGLGLLLTALVLINFEKKGSEKKISLKWLFFVALVFFGNGLCATIQKAQQLAFDGQFKSEFMIVALGLCAVCLGIGALLTEKKQLLAHLKKGMGLFTLCGFANGMVNFLVILLSTRLPASVMFPVISAGGIVVSFCLSLFVYREKLSAMQFVGSGLGFLAVILLNL